MIPSISTGGRTFKAAAAYFLHDRTPDGGPATTADRVAWTHTLNLGTDDPEQAWRIMAYTAGAQDNLKRLAGIKATGRKLDRPTFAFSLSWHPDEQPTQGEMIEAAREALQALGLSDHQTLIMAHRDTAHPHVHVLVNRVSASDGRAAPLSKSKLILSQWAQSYEERQGRILCRARVENNARRAGTRPGRASANRSRRATRPEHRAGGLAHPHVAAQRDAHAEQFSAQAWQEVQGCRRRAAETKALHATMRAGRKAASDRLRHQAELAAHPAQAEAAARSVALLAGPTPADALAVLTRDRSTFTRAELERFVGRHTSDTASFAETLARLDASPELVRAGRDARGRIRFTTATHQDLERRMAELAASLARAQQGQGDVPARFKGWSLARDQSEALHHVLTGNRLSCVSGVAGTGKSTMLDAARQSWEAAGFRVQGMALAAEAAHGLANGSGIAVTGTVHKWLYLWEHGRNLPGPKDVIVVDEAGMIGSRQTERLLHFAAQGGAKIVFVGDVPQLQAIEAGGAFRAMIARVGDVTIRTVRRQKSAWMKTATGQLAIGEVAAALDAYEAQGMVHGHATGRDAKAAVIAAWDEARRAAPGQTQIVMAYLRRDVAELNALARACLRQDGALGPDVTLTTATGPHALARGERVAFQRNDGRMGVRNGSLGTIEALHGRTLTVRLDGDDARRITFSLDHYDHIAHGYAMTVHKSQGVTVDRAHLFCSANLDRHAAYVAMTRHRDRLDLHWSRDVIPDRKRLAAILSRERLKDTSLDYAEDRQREEAARFDAAEAMRERVRRRAAAFAAREETRSGRMENARSLLPGNATALQIARLAFDAAERTRLFRHRQTTLRQWARRVVPPVLAAPVRTVPPTEAERRAAVLAHDAAIVMQHRDMQARHHGERQAESASRRSLQREAATNWQVLALRQLATSYLAKWSGYLGEAWRAACPVTANDNAPGRPPPHRGSRPV